MADIQAYLEVVSKIGTATEGSLRSLQGKQNLLSLLISNEQTRLMVWLFPLDYGKKHHFTSGQHSKTLTDVSFLLRQIETFLIEYQASVTTHLKTAWDENPAIAVHLPKRFQNARLNAEVRFQVLNFPQRVLDEPDAIEILLSNQLPADVTFQLKVSSHNATSVCLD